MYQLDSKGIILDAVENIRGGAKNLKGLMNGWIESEKH